MTDDLKRIASEVANLLEKGEIPPPSKEQMVRTFHRLHDVLELVEQLEVERDQLSATNKAQLAELEAISNALGTNEGHSSVYWIKQLREQVARLRDAIHDVCCNSEVEIFLSGRKILQKALDATEPKK